jgi:hypothetical protein
MVTMFAINLLFGQLSPVLLSSYIADHGKRPAIRSSPLKCFSFIVLAFLSTAVGAQIQEPAPDPLLDAGHCLAAAREDWLGLAQYRPAAVELGYVADTKIYSGQELEYVVQYTTPTHTEGTVFAFLARGKDPHRVLRLQYRTTFRQSDDGSQQVQLADPTFGGIWTQEQVLSAIRQVGFHTYSVLVADLQNRPGSIQCESEPDLK